VKKLLPLLPLATVAALSVAALASGGSRGETYMVSSKLDAKSEVPAPKAMSGAAGTFTGSYAESSKGAVLKWNLTFSHLTGPATAAHIHMGKSGVAGAVLVPLCGPCKSGQSGKMTLSKATVNALEGGKTYVNVHTAKNAGGEIRGQVKAAA
jgi:CHRD domain